MSAPNTTSDSTANTHEVVIAIGSNSEVKKNITAALDALEKQYGVLKCSPVYKSAANTGDKSDDDRTYYNLVVSFNCNEDAKSCKEHLREIENRQGRKRNHIDVSCDLDLLLYGNMCASIENMQIPHNDITQCDYVLRPLADLLPEKEHPQLKQNYKQLWQAFAKSTTLEPVEFKWRETLLSIQPTCLSL